MASNPLPASPSSAPDVTPELQAYYANKPLMWRNVAPIGLCNVGWGVADGIVMPLVTMRLLELGVRENAQATVTSINGWLLSFIVMYFSWRSDHTITRIGRRKPYLFLTAPFIIGAMALFPVFDEKHLLYVLVGLWITKILFMDIKSSTFPLLSIDCVTRDVLARANSVLTIAGGLVGFFAMRNAGRLIEIADWLPYALGACVMTLTTAVAWFIIEPPIHHPPKAGERFKLWSTFVVATKDRRILWLMAGVAMINGYLVMHQQWVWFWAKETLHLQKDDIFKSLSWAALVNIALAYPVGWIIDRWGGFRVVMLLWAAQVGCFVLAMHVHDKASLTMLAICTTIITPLYAGADIMVYKSADARDVGSYTSSNSAIRNAFRALLGLTAGWAIYFAGSDYRVGFKIGMVVSTLGLVMFIIHRHMTRPPRVAVNEPQSPAISPQRCPTETSV